MTWYFLFFFLSGFCCILYEIVWLRLSMAQFGVTSALVAIVLSTFMAGLGVGSWASGRLVRSYGTQAGVLALRLYAATELLIGISALLVPLELRRGRILIESAGLPSSGAYYLASGLWLALTLVPWCACMGATIPLAMASIKNEFRSQSAHSFSYLYLANVMGAAAGAIVPLFFIELYGFHGTLSIGAALNGILAVSAFVLATRIRSQRQVAEIPSDTSAEMSSIQHENSRRPLTLLFATGLTSMGMEVVWIRQFTPYLGTMVYAFAVILALYLLSTSIGSQVYRRWSRQKTREPQALWLALGFCAFLSLAAGDPHFRIFIFLRPVIGIVPFSAVLGFITPMLVDRWSQGNPERAGKAYATNVVGCILGPLLSGFLLLPFTSEHSVVCIFAFPWLIFGMNLPWPSKIERPKQSVVPYAVGLLALVLAFVSKDFESQFQHYEVFRDNAATVVATSEGGTKQLLVNGIGMTSLTAVTKIMAHLPMASLNHQPQSALTICFGMGTTFRSLLSWGVPTTAVELVPSVPRVFGFYHADGPQLLQSPLAHLAVDDGRRYLERTTDQYDVVTLDPPPPIEAAGSGMLYSKEFYAVVKQRLRPDGILQQWLPDGDAVVRSAVARAIYESFRYVRVIQYFPNWGFQFIASQQPIPERTGAELVARMPPSAVRDLMEWPLAPSAEQELNLVLRRETSMVSVLDADPTVGAMQDNQPVNEYVILRNLKRSRFEANYLATWYEHTKKR
jgi:spermidine synthase